MTPPHINPALLPPAGLEPAQRPRAGGAASSARPVSGPSFDRVLQDVEDVRFSKHATQRVERRQLDVSPPVMDRLSDGVLRAAAKGARDAVVLIDETAFVVSVANRTVITAVGREQLRDQVFTNIDSAVIA